MKIIKKLKTNYDKVIIYVPALAIAMKNKRTPLIAKITAALALVYAFSPIDLIPDFIPVLGYLDDFIIIPGLIILSIKLIPKDVFEECILKAKDMSKDGKPKKAYFALFIILTWAASLFVFLYFFKNIF